MRLRAARLLIPLAVVILLVFAFVLFWRARSGEVYGPPVALCPGPDRYGYTCEGAAAYAYIDATTPTNLFADDEVARLALPFPFTFYGAVYDAVYVSTNGNLQFRAGNAAHRPACLSPAPGLGDLVAPYWADLDLSGHGALETEVVGESPGRIFVVEWDAAPLYGADPDDPVTFEVQLFEGSNDVVFLYEDPAGPTGGNGGQAVVGIQSESQGLALAFSCLQPVLPAGGGLRFPHPAEPNPDAGEPVEEVAAPAESPAPAAKGPVADLIAAYAAEGPAALSRLRLRWFNERPQRAFTWRAADLDGGGDELVAVWAGGATAPELSHLAALAVVDGRLAPLFERRLSAREAAHPAATIEEVTDLTGDGLADVVVRDRADGTTWVLSAATGELALFDAPERCAGGLVVRDTDGDGRPEIVRDGCATPGRVHVVWDGAAFVSLP